MDYLEQNKRVSTIGLWGRSMGVSAALLYMKSNMGKVGCCVLDSGFATLRGVIPQITEQKNSGKNRE